MTQRVVQDLRLAGPKAALQSVLNDNFTELFGPRTVDNRTAAYTLTVDDVREVIRINAASGVALTLPNNLPVGFHVTVVQAGAGVVTLTPASGATLVNRQTFTKTAGQHARVELLVTSNSNGTSAQYLLSGDGAV